jgi:hypothetical protein
VQESRKSRSAAADQIKVEVVYAPLPNRLKRFAPGAKEDGEGDSKDEGARRRGDGDEQPKADADERADEEKPATDDDKQATDTARADEDGTQNEGGKDSAAVDS